MISNPVFIPCYTDLSIQEREEEEDDQYKRIGASALPILGFVSELRTPVTLSLGLLKSAVHIQNLISALQNKSLLETTLSSVQLIISLVSVALLISSLVTSHLNPAVAYLFLTPVAHKMSSKAL